MWKRLLDLDKEPNLINHHFNGLEGTRIADYEEMFQQEDLQISIFDLLKQEE